MEKQLYLIRHAQAVNKKSHQIDKDRELTQQGVQESIQIGSTLAASSLVPEVIFASAAERTIQTALIIANALKFDKRKLFYEEALYEATTRTFFEFVTGLDNKYSHVLCIGHNPAISYLAEYLSKGEIGEMQTGSCAIIKFDNSGWNEVSQGSGKLVSYLAP